MFAYFLRKIKNFFVERPILAKLSIGALVLVGVLGFADTVFAQSAYLDAFRLFMSTETGVDATLAAAEWWDSWSLTGMLAELFLFVAGFLGKLVVLVISMLLEIISYNSFTSSLAVEKGWVVLRDLCNLFFILILLVIAFGSILRLEQYKYNKLLGKLIIMIVLVNFSKMIAGFFIDVSQVVLLTFFNAFSAAAATNFTSALMLQEMLGIGTGVGTSWETVGLTLLPVILLFVALFTMVAMLLVFLVRIIMLWILIVLSPLAYLLSVLPATQEYSKKWWTNFTKWVVTGPVLAFFIWFGLSLISAGDTVNIIPETGVSVSDAPIASAQVLMQFSMAIGMFVAALVVAQSLGGIAGSMAGKTMGKLKSIGTGTLKAAASPVTGAAKGVGELAKMGGRKARRTWRDSTVGKYTNVGALMEGAKKRGEEVEQVSREDAAAQGQDSWDKRPGFTGGGADVVSAVETVQRRRERAAAGEVSTLQKEQKSALLEKVWNKGGKQAETTRRALLQSLGAEGHIDDALDTKFFKNEAKWKDAKTGETKNGFKDENGNFDSNMARSNFMRAAVSKGKNRSAQSKDIDVNSLGTLYDIQQSGIRNDHFEYAGEVMANPETGKLALPETLGKDRMEHKNATIKGEIVKPTDRKRIGNHPHNVSVQKDTKDGKDMMRLIPFEPNIKDKPVEPAKDATDEEKEEYKKKSEQYEGQVEMHTENKAQLDEFLHKSNYAKSNPKSFKEFSSSRLGQLLGKFDSEDGTMEIHDDDQFIEQIKALYQEHPDFVNAIQDKTGIKKWSMGDKKYDSLHDFAEEKEKAGNEGWNKNDDYITPDEQQEMKDKEIAKARKTDSSSETAPETETAEETNDTVDSGTTSSTSTKKEKRKERKEKRDKKKGKTNQSEDETTTTETKSATEKTKKSTHTETETNSDTSGHYQDIKTAEGKFDNLPELKISKDSLDEFSSLIGQLTSEVNTGEGIDASKFDKHIEKIGNELSDALANSDSKGDVMDNYNLATKSTSKLNIGTVSEKTLQIRMIDSLNRLSNILRK